VAESDPDLAGIAPPGAARRQASPDDPDAAYRLWITPLGAAGRFLGAGGSGRLSLLVRQAVAAAERMPREWRVRGHGQGG
jgi:hypothetical protein